MERMHKELQSLKLKVEQLERENFALKRSIYDLSNSYAELSTYGKNLQRKKDMFILDPAMSNADSVEIALISERAKTVGRELEENMGKLISLIFRLQQEKKECGAAGVFDEAGNEGIVSRLMYRAMKALSMLLNTHPMATLLHQGRLTKL